MSQMTETTRVDGGAMSRRSIMIRWLVLAALTAGFFYALRNAIPNMIHAALTATPHWPDLALWNAQPLVVQAHVGAAVTAIVIGGVLMTARKGVTFHRTLGWIWAAAMGTTAVVSLFITGLNGDYWSFIHLFSGWTLIMLPLALLAARGHRIGIHRRTMMGLFYGGLIINGFIAFLPGRVMWRLFFG
ncbi:putative membrane protein [Caulobacter ginsengisoli]|uniref:Membrane protein n=1 Tax=Caulobacter ginsengisoli TaxID=400775 RepID=A0ABU0IXV7_9CAUL|nr:hypothetical protein [Caulobacter ginsengisoli]MDQ0466200.1 putative membrane protein [Caulobacter ginsengisoli]